MALCALYFSKVFEVIMKG